MSQTRTDFEAAARAKNWPAAYPPLNGLNMQEMLASLAGLSSALLDELSAARSAFVGRLNTNRIEFAVKVVKASRMPAETPSDVMGDQEEVAWAFLKQRPVDATSNPPMEALTFQQLQHVMWKLDDDRAAAFTGLMNEAMPLYGINNRLRWAAFLAQVAEESMQLMHWDELPSAFASSHSKYHGRGPIQLTGHANYQAAGAVLGEDLVAHPERAAAWDLGFRIAGWFWQKHGLNTQADRGHFREITRRINGGFLGESTREMFHARALKAF